MREAPVEHRPALPRVAAAPAANRPRVLLVDDEAFVRGILAAQLRDGGFDVLEAGEGYAALAVLDRGGALDAMVSDLAMPGLDGVALTREAKRRRRPGLPVIPITGYAGDAATLAPGNGEGSASALVRKPITGAELADQVAVVLRAKGRRLQAVD